VNEDFEEICQMAMQSLNCPMAGIRTDLFEMVRYAPNVDPSSMPRSLPTFRRMAQRGKPCVVLDVQSDKRITDTKRTTSRIQFFVGVPLVLENGECIGDICVADVKPRKVIDYQNLEIVKVLAQSASAYMSSSEYLTETTQLNTIQGKNNSSSPLSNVASNVAPPIVDDHNLYSHADRFLPPLENLGEKEVAF
jgi:GAF domain-containing protein